MGLRIAPALCFFYNIFCNEIDYNPVGQIY